MARYMSYRSLVAFILFEMSQSDLALNASHPASALESIPGLSSEASCTVFVHNVFDRRRKLYGSSFMYDDFASVEPLSLIADT